MLDTDHLARVSDFVAVPGCGLKCNVSQIEMLLDGSISDIQIINTRNLDITYQVHDEADDMMAAAEGQFSCFFILAFGNI